jgi:hypothetical protein
MNNLRINQLLKRSILVFMVTGILFMLFCGCGSNDVPSSPNAAAAAPARFPGENPRQGPLPKAKGATP